MYVLWCRCNVVPTENGEEEADVISIHLLIADTIWFHTLELISQPAGMNRFNLNSVIQSPIENEFSEWKASIECTP